MRTNYIKCGDCLELMSELPDNSVDVVFTSPPYNRVRNDTYEYYNDISSDFFELLTNFTDEALRLSRDKVIVNIQQNHFNKVDFFRYIGYYAENISGTFMWCKTNPQPNNNYRKKENTISVTNAVEWFIFLTKDGKCFRNYGKKGVKNYIETSINSKHIQGHGAIMKKEVCEYFLKYFTKKGDIVLDPFCGCGTTGVVCAEHGREFIGFDIVPEYCRISVDRIREARKQNG